MNPYPHCYKNPTSYSCLGYLLRSFSQKNDRGNICTLWYPKYHNIKVVTFFFCDGTLALLSAAHTLLNFCVVLYIVCFVSFSVLFVCICVLYYCHRVATQLQLNISYHISVLIKNVRFKWPCYHLRKMVA